MAPPRDDDPRLHDEYVRTVPGDAADDAPAGASNAPGDVTLVGVVHDHPASAHRVRALIEDRDPATVALELSPLALPLFEAYADAATDDGATSGTDLPARGGEMSAAIRAADCDVVGIDAPSVAFVRRLAARIRAERPSPRTVARVLRGVAGVTRHALVCRAGAAVARLTGRPVELDEPVDHDCTAADPPAAQADDERRQASRSLSLTRAFETPEPVHLRDATREACMAAKLADLRREGDALAVVGIDHLDGVAAELA